MNEQRKPEMPVDVSWLYENRVIMMRNYGKVTSQQVVAAMEKSNQMIRQGKSPVHIITDGTGVEGSIEVALADLKNMIPKAIEGTGLIVSIQHGAMSRFVAAVGMQLAGVRYKFVNDEQEALRVLIEYDPTLKDIVH
jgi:hypothetical protein